METLAVAAVSDNDVRELAELVQRLPRDSALSRSVTAMLEALRAGDDVLISPAEAHMTPTQAAAFLGMSRAHLYKLLDAGDIPFLRVGRDRRLVVSDVMAFDERRQVARRSLAERFAHADRDQRALIDELLDAGA